MIELIYSFDIYNLNIIFFVIVFIVFVRNFDILIFFGLIVRIVWDVCIKD